MYTFWIWIFSPDIYILVKTGLNLKGPKPKKHTRQYYHSHTKQRQSKYISEYVTGTCRTSQIVGKVHSSVANIISGSLIEVSSRGST